MNDSTPGHTVTVTRPSEDRPEATATCVCGWVSALLWSRRRAHEAGADHVRAVVAASVPD